MLAADSTVMLHLGLASPGLQTRTDGRSVLTAPWVLVCAEPVDNVRELLRPLGRSGDRPLTVAAPGFDEGTISTLLANLMAGTVQVQALVGPPEERVATRHHHRRPPGDTRRTAGRRRDGGRPRALRAARRRQ